MTTTRKRIAGVLSLTAAITMGAQAFSAVRSNDRKPAGANPKAEGVASLTDAAGNPIDPQASATATDARAMAQASKASMVHRGQAWWPFATSALPPYGPPARRVESMSEDEIVVNPAVGLNIRDIAATHDQAPRELLLPPGRQLAGREGFYLIKIEGFTRNQAQVDALTNAGAVLGEYLNVNTYVAKIPSSSFAAVKRLPFVTFVGDYHPAYKISPRIGLEDIPAAEAADPVTGQANPWTFEVILHKGADVNEVLGELAKLQVFPKDEDIVANDALNVLFVHIAPELVTELAQIPGVKWIAEKSYPELQASSSSPATIPMMLQNNGTFTATTATGWKLWNAGIDGTGQIVTMMDSGLNTKMYHFADNTISTGTPGPAHRKVVGYDVYGGGNLCVADTNAADGGHGTKTSQHAVGSISNMTSSPDLAHVPNANWDDGIARGAKVYFQDIGLDTSSSISPPADLGPSITAAIAKGSFIQNHSWGTATDSYDATASNLDSALFANPNFVATISAGNRGAIGTSTLGSPGTAKNGITVGGNDVAHPDSLFIDCTWDGTAACANTDLGSSRGPVTTSLRVKPDIMSYIYASAPVGNEVMAYSAPTAMCQTDATKNPYFNYTNVGFEGGTSFAAPDIAGLAALVRDYFVRGFYPSGTATPANTVTPSGALIKAVILASGEDMAATASPQGSAITERYGSDVGYGRANLPGALHIGNSAPFLWVQNNDTLGDSATKSFSYNINSNTTPLRVMMVYYDAAGNALQKDADLKVTIGANTYWGNNFAGGWSTSAAAIRDHTNNTEGVFLDATHGLPASGTFTVEVIGFNDPGGMNYSLVVVGDVASQSVTRVSLNSGKYRCNQTINITVNDTAATSPVSVTLVSKDAASATIDTKIVSCAGASGVFTGSIQAGSGIAVVNGGTLTATYAGAVASVGANVVCQVPASDQGFRIEGGCDNASAGSDAISGPLFNAGSNEFYTRYMDAGEASSYAFKFKNESGMALTDLSVNLSFSGPGAAKMSVLNNPVHIGFVPVDAIVGAVFQVRTDPSTTGLTAVNMDFDLTSPADGYSAASRLTQPQLLQTNDQVSRQASCAPFNTSVSPFVPSAATSGHIAATWKWSGAATSRSTVGSELRVDGACGSATADSAAMVGNSGTSPASNNFPINADSFLYLSFQPVLRGNNANGQPYRYTWKWHSFYAATEALNSQGGLWGAYYDDKWNNATAPLPDELKLFSLRFAYLFFASFDYVSSWNWDAPNTGIPDDPHFDPSTGGAPNQFIISFGGVTGFATTSSRFVYAHRVLDSAILTGTAAPHNDLAIDNDRLVYDEYFAASQAAASCGAGGQVGQVAFDLTDYTTCPHGSAILSVVDANGVSGLLVTVTSPGTGDSEVVALTGSAPYFTATLNLSTDSGFGSNDGTLFVLPNETISAAYTDSAPAGSSIATASTACRGGNVNYLTNAQVSDNGDNDGIADNGETVTVDITVENTSPVPLTNAKVTIISDSPNVDCVSDSQALYGTIPGNSAVTNPGGDRFTFHVIPSVACSDPLNPPTAHFIVLISGDGVDGAATLQGFTVNLDQDATGLGFTYTQNFNADPGWETGSTPDDSNDPTCGPYVNDFHWCAVCGNGNGGYGAWTGNLAFGTTANYRPMGSSTLYSPSFVANGPVGLQFSLAYRTEPTYDGATVQYQLGTGSWTDLAFSSPAQGVTSTQDFCSPFNASHTAWTGNGNPYTLTNTATVPSALGQSVQFRWRLGSDSSIVGTTYGGLGVDDVSVTNLRQMICEPTRNTGLPGCPFSCTSAPDGTPCNDGNACTTPDTCQSGTCTGTSLAPSAEAAHVVVAADKVTYSWDTVAGATRYDAVRGLLSALPVGPGGLDETCFDNLATASVTDATIPSPGTGFFYLARGENTCVNGSYGTQSNLTPRTSTTCP